ncbi:MHYT domain-containing protein [Bacillus pinisoli]|uniref:MHYT domain-containing protein n=1 Tax=Bacillus pinisoli TaxID=2901866 RepID=UPI001FF318BE|nr:MHYT domain-containing protein [Bacillus pinisoli]
MKLKSLDTPVTLGYFSVVIAMLTSYTAVHLLSRVTTYKNRDRILLFVASVIMGGGIWTMHFIGMLSVHIDIPMTYNLKLVGLSLILPIGTSILSFWFIEHHTKNRYSLVLSSLIMGAGIAGMHYTGMA